MSTILIQALNWHKAGEHSQICAHYDQIMAHAMANPSDSEGCRLLIQMALIESQDREQVPKHIPLAPAARAFAGCPSASQRFSAFEPRGCPSVDAPQQLLGSGGRHRLGHRGHPKGH